MFSAPSHTLTQNGKALRIACAQVNPTLGDLAYNQDLIFEAWDKAEADGADILVLPELVLSGYPPEDLVLNAGFLKATKDAIQSIVEKSNKYKCAALIGCPWIDDNVGDANDTTISAKRNKPYNALLVIENGEITHRIYKHHLPDYGVFDESRVFASAPFDTLRPVDFRGHSLGIMICEDMWFADISRSLSEHGAELLIVPNASPFYSRKNNVRLEHAKARVAETKLPLVYVQTVGGQDELVFDGYSFAMDAKGDIVAEMRGFIPDYSVLDFQNGSFVQTPSEKHRKDTDIEQIYKALTLGLQDYVRKNGFKGIVLGLSGGVDSALAAAIAVDALGADHVRCIMMSSKYTSEESITDAEMLAKNLGASLESIPIDDTVKALEETLTPNLHTRNDKTDIPPVTFENLQSRARGIILMALSNASGAMVLTTGNKSEMATGYATLYGDMCGGFNALKDVYKTQVYALCRWRNEAVSNDIPERILTRAPSAELRDNQTDQDSLPPYDILDAVLKLYIEENLSISDVVAKGYEKEIAQKIWALLHRAEYKRRQSAPGTKITPRAFSRDRRYPITNRFRG